MAVDRKEFGGIEQNRTWTTAWFFQVRASGDLERIRSELDGVVRTGNVQYRSTQLESGRTDNSIFGFVAGNREPLLEAQRRLQEMGWQPAEGLSGGV